MKTKYTENKDMLNINENPLKREYEKVKKNNNMNNEYQLNLEDAKYEKSRVNLEDAKLITPENKDILKPYGKQLKFDINHDNKLIFASGDPVNIKEPTEGLIRRIKKAGVHLEDIKQVTPENINVWGVQKLLTDPDYKIRFIGEYWELYARVRSLNAMVVKYKAGTLDFTPSCKYGILSTQLRHMKNYLESLKVRAAIEEIDLNSVFTLIHTLKDNYTDVVVNGSKENIPTVHVICKDNLSNVNILSEDVQTGELTKVNSKPDYSVENDGKYIECIII